MIVDLLSKVRPKESKLNCIQCGVLSAMTKHVVGLSQDILAARGLEDYKKGGFLTVALEHPISCHVIFGGLFQESSLGLKCAVFVSCKDRCLKGNQKMPDIEESRIEGRKRR